MRKLHPAHHHRINELQHHRALLSHSYSFRVRAYDAATNNSGYSNTASATTTDITAPSAPASLTASAASGTQINLNWSAASDNVGVAAYDLEYCQGGGCSNFGALTSTGSTSFNATGLTPATSYNFRVRARDVVPNYGGYSPTASATTHDSVAPSIPGSLTASVISHARVDLSWFASTDNVAVTGYSLERCQGAGCSSYAQIATPAGASFSDTGVSESTSYRYRVLARDAVPNWSSPSNIAIANTPAAPDTQVPTAPSGLNATAESSAQINLSWSASTDNVGVTGYAVQRCQGAGCTGFSQIATPSGTTFSDSGLSPSTAYRYQVLARDAVPNWSGASNIASGTTPAPPDTQAPSAPTGLQLAAGPNKVVLSWSPSTDNVAVIEYRVERCEVASGCLSYSDLGGTSTANYTDATAVGLTSYRYRVRARDAVPNYSGYSSTSDAIAASCD
jgi:chitodextrinase